MSTGLPEQAAIGTIELPLIYTIKVRRIMRSLIKCCRLLWLTFYHLLRVDLLKTRTSLMEWPFRGRSCMQDVISSCQIQCACEVCGSDFQLYKSILHIIFLTLILLQSHHQRHYVVKCLTLYMMTSDM